MKINETSYLRAHLRFQKFSLNKISLSKMYLKLSPENGDNSTVSLFLSAPKYWNGDNK